LATKEKFSTVENVIYISAKEVQHIDVLKEKMVDAVTAGKLQTKTRLLPMPALSCIKRSRKIIKGFKNRPRQ